MVAQMPINVHILISTDEAKYNLQKSQKPLITETETRKQIMQCLVMVLISPIQ